VKPLDEVTVPAALLTTTLAAPADPAGTVAVHVVDEEQETLVAAVPPTVIVGVEVLAGVATVGRKFVPTTVIVSPALPDEPEPTVVFVTLVIVGDEP